MRWKVAAPLRARIGLIGSLLMLTVAVEVPAQEASEYQVKAAFVLNFTKFTEWPSTAFANSQSPIAICILGENPFGDALSAISKGETANGRSLTVQVLQQVPAPGTCQLLFVARSAENIPKILSDVGKGVLTVGDNSSFLRDGGVVAFFTDNRRIRFDISQTTAERNGLKLSSRLLNVARTVK